MKSAHVVMEDVQDTRSVVPSGKRKGGRLSYWGPYAASLTLGAILWEIIGHFVSPLFFAPFSKVVMALWKLIISGELWVHTSVTFTELIVGYSLAIIVGLAGGIATSLSKPMKTLFDPWLTFIYSCPYVAFSPLLIISLGLGMAPKMAIAFIGGLIPIWWNTQLGFMSTEPAMIEVARAFGANRSQVVFLVMFRYAVPSFLVGLRLGFSRALIGVIVTEFMAATAGLGYLIDDAGSWLLPDVLLAGVLTIGMFSIVVVEFLKWLETKLAPWGLRA